MIKSAGNITTAKQKILSLKDKDVAVKVNLGRNKYAFYKGRVTGIYPSLFTVLPISEFKGKTTFSYSEMLCGNVFVKNLADFKK